MGVVVGDLLLLIVLIIVIASAGFAVSVKKEAAAKLIRERAATEQRVIDEREAKRRQPGIPLICLSCDTRFSGPMPEDGCPNCHHASLVITSEELDTTRQAAPGGDQE